MEYWLDDSDSRCLKKTANAGREACAIARLDFASRESKLRGASEVPIPVTLPTSDNRAEIDGMSSRAHVQRKLSLEQGVHHRLAQREQLTVIWKHACLVVCCLRCAFGRMPHATCRYTLSQPRQTPADSLAGFQRNARSDSKYSCPRCPPSRRARGRLRGFLRAVRLNPHCTVHPRRSRRAGFLSCA